MRRSSVDSSLRKHRRRGLVHPYHHSIPRNLSEIAAIQIDAVRGKDDNVSLTAENLDVDGLLDFAVEAGALERRSAPGPGVLPGRKTV